MRTIPISNWLRDRWMSQGPAPHIFVEDMRGTIIHKELDVYNLSNEDWIKALKIRRAIVVLPDDFGTAIIINVIDARLFYRLAKINHYDYSLLPDIFPISGDNPYIDIVLTDNLKAFLCLLQAMTMVEHQYA